MCNSVSNLITKVLDDESSTFVVSGKEMMVTCDSKYEPSFFYLKGYLPINFGYDGKKFKEDDISNSYFFKQLYVKSVTSFEKDIFVIISYDWMLNIDKNELDVIRKYISETPNGTPIDRDFYKKYRKYFYLESCNPKIHNEFHRKGLSINEEGILVVNTESFDGYVPA